MSSSFNRLKYKLQELLRKNKVEVYEDFSCIEAYISYSKNQENSAKCLKGLLEFSGLSVVLLRRGSIYGYSERIHSIGFYFSFLPHDYGHFNEESYFKQEIASLVTSGVDCRVIFLEDQEEHSPALEVLLQSIRASTNRDIAVIDFLPFRNEMFDTSRKLERIYMTSTEKNVSPTAENAEDIMTKFSELLTVTPDSLFSELFFRMVTMGVRHIPVIDSEEKKNYLRVITRRDLFEKVPPGGAYLPEEAQVDCGINLDRKKLKKELKELGKKKIKDVFPEDQNLSIRVDKTDPLKKVITFFARKQQLGNKKGYISAIPVLDKDGKLEGIISYTDVFKRFLRFQEDFLNSSVAVVSRLGRMSDDDEIDTLSESDKLNDAFMTFATTGRRSLPVVADDDDEKLIGYLEDMQVKIFNYRDKDFADQLGNLGVEYMMTRADRLYTPSPEQRLSTFIDEFWKPLNGSAPASSFAVCKAQDTTASVVGVSGYKELAGVLSYVDVLDKWLDPSCWNKI